MKPVRFVGNARLALSRFPAEARNRAGHDLFMVQVGRESEKTRKTAMLDVRLAKRRYRDVVDMESGGHR